MFRDLVEKMARALVRHPEQVRVSEIVTDQTLVIEVEVAHRDIGRILGKKGRNADAMRTILTGASAHSRKRVMLEIAS